ncbi:hypothetical protein F383_09485 [Gossypium arboreum]|uniref:Uncharacterized protein n=1 Tax=Gossypium arboreum TaxID=29729 RepID=A0A0B0PF21_GOSAR|nr:hypothetical protein F383_09485 [Gossypium arboreum]
MTRRLLGN